MKKQMNSMQNGATLWQKPCCPDCEKFAQQGAALGDYHDLREGLLLSEQQARMYWAWVSELNRKYAEAGDILEDVCLTFTFSPMGRTVIVHTTPVNVLEGMHCTLEDPGWDGKLR